MDRPQLNWLTYAKLLEMSGQLLEALRPYGARDFIDVQSFIWMVGGVGRIEAGDLYRRVA
jgi:hypothetical protein